MAELTELDLGDGTSREISDAKSRANFAPEFSASTSYAVDDIVTYEGVLYKCTAVHSAGAWNNAHFAQTTCADAFSGGGSSVKKTRYTITSSGWSASANSDGYYTYTQILSPAVKSSPDVYVAGSTDSTQPTDAQRAQFGYVERCKVNGSTLTLYAKTKPTANFYVWVEGEEGTGSGDIVGNVVMPNTGIYPLEREYSLNDMTFDRTTNSYPQTVGSEVVAPPSSGIYLMTLVGTSIPQEEGIAKEITLGQTILIGDMAFSLNFYNKIVDAFVLLNSGANSGDGRVYVRVSKWFFDNKVSLDTLKLRYYKMA